MRLIDADKFKKDVKSVTLSNGTLINTNIMLALLDKYPTAYDVDKVVEELKNADPQEMMSEEQRNVLNYAIEIVKQGGVTDDVCEWKLRTDGSYKMCKGDIMEYVKGWKHCPYCGKKIKVVE